jgi:hypothetical protein
MKDKELHPVVKLLLKRMESHPEEFDRHEEIYGDRWSSIVADILEYGNQDDISAVRAAMRDIRLGEAHEDMMDELLNGDDRRRKEEADREYEKQLVQQMQQQQYQQMVQQQGLTAAQAPYFGSFGNTSSSQMLTLAPTNFASDSTLNIGGETLDAGMLKKIKGALGI